MPHSSNVLLHVVNQFQRDSYENCSDDECIVSCEWTKEIFINFSYTYIIKRVEEKYEALDGLEQEGIAYLKIAFDDMFNMSDVVITSLYEVFKNFDRYGVAKYPSKNVALIVQQINYAADHTLWVHQVQCALACWYI